MVKKLRKTRIPLKLLIENTSCRQKRNEIEQLSQILVHIDITTTKRVIYRQKFQNQPIRHQIR